ncbi:MAG: hypothetical protein AAF670_06845 [Planctomycetota bacterium]
MAEGGSSPSWNVSNGFDPPSNDLDRFTDSIGPGPLKIDRIVAVSGRQYFRGVRFFPKRLFGQNRLTSISEKMAEYSTAIHAPASVTTREHDESFPQIDPPMDASRLFEHGYRYEPCFGGLVIETIASQEVPVGSGL